ncbi:MAG: peptidase M15 [Candidatus Improbicoccus devescovinae]|nr:MAG: peptidase M15 [Candidatus Improbicoccus devescovinae]
MARWQTLQNFQQRSGFVRRLNRKFLKYVLNFLCLFVFLCSSTFSMRPAPTESAVDLMKKPSDFVDVSKLDPSIQVDLQYFGEANFVGRKINGYEANKAFLQQGAAKALIAANKILEKQGLGIVVYDAYRPRRAVDEFVTWAKDPFDTKTKKEFYPDFDKMQLLGVYISGISRHATGRAVDVFLYDLCDENKKVVDMGCRFDFFGERSSHDAKGLTEEQTESRNKLKTAMESSGFKSYDKEFWHYEFPKTNTDPDVFYDFVICEEEIQMPELSSIIKTEIQGQVIY